MKCTIPNYIETSSNIGRVKDYLASAHNAIFKDIYSTGEFRNFSGKLVPYKNRESEAQRIIGEYNKSIKSTYGITDNILSLGLQAQKDKAPIRKVIVNSLVLENYYNKIVQGQEATKLITDDIERGADPEFYTGQYQKESNYGSESLEGLSQKISRLKANFGVKVILDSDISELARVDPYEAGENPTIRINPRLVNKDTVIHEFGHVYINLLGGKSNKFISDGIEQLKGTDLWNRVASNYPELSTEELEEEVLATAIGEEGSKVFDNEQDRSKWINWLSSFFDKLKSLIGIPPNVAKSLAKEMFGNTLRVGVPKGTNYYQKQKITNVVDLLKEVNNNFTDNGDILIKDGIPFRSTSKIISEDFKRNTLEKVNYERSILNIFSLINKGLSLGEVKDSFKEQQSKSKFGYLVFLDDNNIEQVYNFSNNFIEKLKAEGKTILLNSTIVNDKEGVNIAGNMQISSVSKTGKVDIYNFYVSLGEENNSDRIVAEQSLQTELLKSMGVTVSSIYTLPISIVDGNLYPKKIIENNINREYIKKYFTIGLSEESFTKLKNTSKKLIGVLKRKVDIIAKNINSKTPIQKERFDEFKQTINDLADAEEINQISSFLETATRETSALYKRLNSIIKDDNYTVEDLKTIYDYTQAYRSIDEVSNLLRDPNIADELKDENYLDQVRVVKEHIDNINSTYKTYVKKAFARAHRKEGKLFAARRAELEREFGTIEAKRYLGQGLNSKQIKEKKLEFINRKIADEYESLLQEEEDRIFKLLGESDTDIGSADLWLTDSRNLNDEILQLSENKLSVADFLTTSATQEVYSDVDQTFIELLNLKGQTYDQKELYKELIESYNGSTTGYYVSEYFSEFDKQKKDIWSKYYNTENKDSDEAFKLYTDAIKWNKENIQGKYTESFQNEMNKFLNTDESSYKINRILAKYSDKGNISKSDLTKIKEILNSKKKNKIEGSKQFYEKVEFIENESFIETKKRKQKQLGTNYQAWLDAQYYYRGDKLQLLPMWSELVPKDKSLLNPNVGKPKDKWKNPQFDTLESLRKSNSPIAKMYDKLISYNKQSDEMVPDSQKLGYKLPSIEKSTIERVSDKGPWFAIKEGFLNSFRKTNEDLYEYGEEQGKSISKKGMDSLRNVISEVVNVFTSEDGQEKKAIPIHYRKELKNPEDQSYDLATLCLVNYQNCKNYSEKTKIALDLEVAKDLLYERQINQYTPDGKLKLDNYTGEAVSNTGNSNTYKAFQTLLDTRLYGIRMVGDASFNKKIGQLNNWASGTVMMLNYLSAPANLLHGKVTSLIESVSSTYYNTTNLKNGESEYTKDTKNILSDIGKRRPNSKTNILLDKFNVLGLFDASHNKFAENTKVSKLGKTNSLYVLQSGGEHMIQGSIMYAYLDTVKISGPEGDLKFTDSINIIDGKIIAKEGYEKALDPELLYKISTSLSRILSQQFGNYSDTNIAAIQRLAIGNSIFSLKKFFVTGAKKRYRGIGNWKNKIGEDDYNTQYLDPTLGHFVEGDYITAFRTLRTMYLDFKTLKMQAIGQTWDNMTDIEKGRFKRTMIELNLALFALLMSIAIKGDDDEEENVPTLMTAFLTRRLYSELSFWVNPIEISRTLRTPAQSLSFAEKIFRLLAQLTSPFEEYEKGDKKGEKKVWKKISDITPIYSQYNRSLENAVDFLYK